MKMFKFIILAMLFTTVFITSIGVNVIAHEGAHYLVADELDLDPSLHLKPENISAKTLYSMDSELAYVQYSSRSSAAEDAMIAVVGPLANLGIGLFALMFYIDPKQRKTVRLLLMVVLVTSFVSFGVNILPFVPSDGYYIFSYLGTLIS